MNLNSRELEVLEVGLCALQMNYEDRLNIARAHNSTGIQNRHIDNYKMRIEDIKVLWEKVENERQELAAKPDIMDDLAVYSI